MFTPHSFSESIEISPKHLSNNYQNQILGHLQDKRNRTVVEGSCIIREVTRIITCENPVVLHGKIFAKVQYEANAFKPSIGELYDGFITNVLPLGIIIESDGLVRVLIQASTLSESYKYDPSRVAFTNNLSSLSIGSHISFRIKSFKVNNNRIDCISVIVPPKITPVIENSEEYVLEPPEY